MKKLKNKKPKCPRCGVALIDAGCYKWDCKNGCYPMALELWQMQRQG
jgi:tRNA(Ile2) C34 agmatinyltransferase TiaS